MNVAGKWIRRLMMWSRLLLDQPILYLIVCSTGWVASMVMTSTRTANLCPWEARLRTISKASGRRSSLSVNSSRVSSSPIGMTLISRLRRRMAIAVMVQSQIDFIMVQKRNVVNVWCRFWLLFQGVFLFILFIFLLSTMQSGEGGCATGSSRLCQFPVQNAERASVTVNPFCLIWSNFRSL